MITKEQLERMSTKELLTVLNSEVEELVLEIDKVIFENKRLRCENEQLRKALFGEPRFRVIEGGENGNNH